MEFCIEICYRRLIKAFHLWRFPSLCVIAKGRSITERFFSPQMCRPSTNIACRECCISKSAVPATWNTFPSRSIYSTAYKCLFSMLHKKYIYIFFLSCYLWSAYKETSLATGGLVNCEKENRWLAARFFKTFQVASTRLQKIDINGHGCCLFVNSGYLFF